MAMVLNILHEVSRWEYKPPVTLILIAVNIVAWLGTAPHLLISGRAPMMCPSAIVAGEQPWTDLLLASFMHAPDGGYHLIYNMSSLLWKGVSLEVDMGSWDFAGMVAFMLAMSHILFVPVAYLATATFGANTYHGCAIGFSAVLFGLKVVLNHSQLGEQAMNLWGIVFPVEAKYAAWLELFVISLIAPEASFVGHFCGILAGLLWLQWDRTHLTWKPKPRRSSWGSGAVGQV